MPKGSLTSPPGGAQARVRRGYFECRYGQLHVHAALPPGGGFEEGAPLLCLHDGQGSARIFTRFLAIAGKERSVYAADLPGFGESDAPALRPTIAVTTSSRPAACIVRRKYGNVSIRPVAGSTNDGS